METHNNILETIDRLRKNRNAVILAHNYQLPEIQDVADYVGDSFELSRKAAGTDADVIVFCGVRFMAETAAILSPEKLVILPDETAGCSLADSIDADQLRELKREHPGVPVVCYVNSSAEVKAESDVCCTSANAVRVARALEGGEIIFVPDRNLADYVSRFVEKKIIKWSGFCPTHSRVTTEEVQAAKKAYPTAPVVVHPECDPEVIDMADHVASTSGILEFCRKTDARTVIVGTESGILHRLKKENPEKEFVVLSPSFFCETMKFINLQKLARSLEKLEPVISVAPEIRERALNAVERMLRL